MQFDENEIRKALAIVKGEDALFECRLIRTDKKNPRSGYFRSADKLIEELKKQDLEKTNVYFTLNTVNEQCYGREQANRFIVNPPSSTNDNDIVSREWIFIDLDARRSSSVSATDDQVRAASRKANSTYKYLKEQGFPDPIIAFSGNGFHLLYRLQLKNSDENTELLKKFINTLDALLTDDDVEIDRSVFNASRICKLYGTVSKKGRNTPEYPHRMSKIMYVPNEIRHVEKKYIEKVANSLVMEQTQANRYNGYNSGSFILEDWLHEHGIHYRESAYGDGSKFILDCCPFNPDHKGKDAAIIRSRSGALGYNCFHNSCASKTWRDVRLLFEPDAYSKKWENQKRIQYTPNSERQKELPKSQPIVEEENKPIFLTAQNILDRPFREQTFVKTGIQDIDKRMRGLMKGHVSVWSGLRGSAKSTLLSQIALNAVNDGCTAIVYSGELNEKNFMRWMNQQAAGHNTEPSPYPGYFNTPIAIQKLIAQWLGEKFFLYDNAYGNDFEAVIEKIENQVEKTNADLVILDNLMAFNISSMGFTKWDAQTAFVWKLHELALKHTVHIAFVAHPKKAAGFLRFNDISGTADIGNAVDDAFIVHRNNEDFRRLSAEMFHWKSSDPVYDGTNVIEIVKDRDGGNQDVFIPLYYEARSKRLKNSKEENVVYGWEENYSPVRVEKKETSATEDYVEWSIATQDDEEFIFD